MGVVDAEDGFGFHRKPGQIDKGSLRGCLRQTQIGAEYNGDVRRLLRCNKRSIIPIGCSDQHRTANPAGVAKYAQITLNFGRAAGGFFRIVRELDGRSAIH